MYETRIKRVWIQWGWMKAFSIGLHISSFQVSLDLIVFYIQAEFPMTKRRKAKFEKKLAKNKNG